MDLLKNLNNMITAKLILTGKETYDSEYPTVSKYDALDAMIEFAKLHVEAALKKASEEAKTFDVYNESCGDLECKVTFIKKDSILNSYSLENIK